LRPARADGDPQLEHASDRRCALRLCFTVAVRSGPETPFDSAPQSAAERLDALMLQSEIVSQWSKGQCRPLNGTSAIDLFMTFKARP
jgi:hypothetical protein